MTSEKMLSLIRFYRERFEHWGIGKRKAPHDKWKKPEHEVLAHCHNMLDKMEGFVAEGRMEKAFRWLGFIQGCLWSFGEYSLEELKNHSKPD